MRRFSLKALLAVIGLLAICLAVTINWHMRSMLQYRELIKLSNRGMYGAHGLTQAFQEDQVQRDPDTGLLKFHGGRIGEPRGGSKRWLCKQFDCLYVLSTPYVWVGEPLDEAKEQVSRLKGVTQIVVFGSLDPAERKRWEERFPDAKILFPKDIGYDDRFTGPFG